jgi:hypothetical protein
MRSCAKEVVTLISTLPTIFVQLFHVRLNSQIVSEMRRVTHTALRVRDPGCQLSINSAPQFRQEAMYVKSRRVVIHHNRLSLIASLGKQIMHHAS